MADPAASHLRTSAKQCLLPEEQGDEVTDSLCEERLNAATSTDSDSLLEERRLLQVQLY